MKSKKMKTKNKRPSEGDELLAEVVRYRRGIGRYDLTKRMSYEQRIDSILETIESWEELESKIEHRLYKVGIKL